MKELKTKIEREVRTDWLGTLKSLFVSSDIENNNSEYENWARANQDVLAVEEANIAKLESLLDRPNVNIKRREQRTKTRQATEKYVANTSRIMQENSKEIEHEER